MATNNAVNSGLSGTTGTGNFVGSTSPSITTPKIITQINDTNGNELLGITATGSAVNFVNLTNNATGSAPILTGTGSDSNVGLTLLTKGTGGVATKGTGTNDNAAAGYVGEVISSTIASGSAVSINTATATDMTSISLTAGDWDVFGSIHFLTAAATLTAISAWSSVTSATRPDTSLYSGFSGVALGDGSLITPFLRLSLASTTTVYISAQVTFASGGASMCGSIFARRRR